jgi:hypothetical protein
MSFFIQFDSKYVSIDNIIFIQSIHNFSFNNYKHLNKFYFTSTKPIGSVHDVTNKFCLINISYLSQEQILFPETLYCRKPWNISKCLRVCVCLFVFVFHFRLWRHFQFNTCTDLKNEVPVPLWYSSDICDVMRWSVNMRFHVFQHRSMTYSAYYLP